MRKLLSLILILIFTFSFSQKYTIAQVEKTSDPKVIAVFLKDNPGHPKTAELKSKLFSLITKDNDVSAKPTVKPLKKGKLEREVNRESGTSKGKQTANVLTELFNNDPNKKTVVVQIKNRSACNLIVKFSGNEFYNLNVPAKNESYVVVKKGKYILTTQICDAKYSSVKELTKDISIALNAK